MKTNKKRICFIGHRYINYFPAKKRLTEIIKIEIENGCKFFTMGTYGQFDSLALEVCRELRHTYKNIEIEVVVTSLNKIKTIVYNDTFGHETYVPYNDVKTIMYDIESEHYKRKITISNRQMIDSCDTLIAYVDNQRSYGGAISAYKYVKKKGLRIINIYN
ncbi:MAG: hypothetical protein IJF22_02695 [Clostridia bacterium]|nr:hypothetical protein [Clostridia bacterium]